jgi:hypothetical protein
VSVVKKMGIEKRTAILYARVKPSSKLRVQKLAKRYGLSESEAINKIFEWADIEALLQKET